MNGSGLNRRIKAAHAPTSSSAYVNCVKSVRVCRAIVRSPPRIKTFMWGEYAFLADSRSKRLAGLDGFAAPPVTIGKSDRRHQVARAELGLLLEEIYRYSSAEIRVDGSPNIHAATCHAAFLPRHGNGAGMDHEASFYFRNGSSVVQFSWVSLLLHGSDGQIRRQRRLDSSGMGRGLRDRSESGRHVRAGMRLVSVGRPRAASATPEHLRQAGRGRPAQAQHVDGTYLNNVICSTLKSTRPTSDLDHSLSALRTGSNVGLSAAHGKRLNVSQSTRSRLREAIDQGTSSSNASGVPNGNGMVYILSAR
jgi:hypothetical protein